jgi:Na+-driven multidrug efflux pump
MTMWRITCIGIPSSLQMSFRALMDVVLMTLVAQFGTLSVAAYSVGVRLRMVGLFPIFGFANAAATMVGQNLGAGKLERSRRSAWVATGISFATASVAALGFCVFADWLIGLFNSDPSVIRAGADFLRITSLGLMAAAVGIVLGRSLNGAGDTLSPLIITLVALWGFQIPAAVYLSGIPRIYGVDIPGTRYLAALATDSVMGIWYAILVASFLQAAAVSVWFSTGRWKKARV